MYWKKRRIDTLFKEIIFAGPLKKVFFVEKISRVCTVQPMKERNVKFHKM